MVGHRKRGDEPQLRHSRVLRPRVQQPRARHRGHFAAGRPNGIEGVRLHRPGSAQWPAGLHVHPDQRGRDDVRAGGGRPTAVRQVHRGGGRGKAQDRVAHDRDQAGGGGVGQASGSAR